MNNQSDTPRTDAERDRINKLLLAFSVKATPQLQNLLDFARTLERELNELRVKFDSDGKHLIKTSRERDALAAKLKKALKCAEVLREIKLAFDDGYRINPNQSDHKAAEQALRELEG